MPLIPRKRCPKCKALFEGYEVVHTHSCDICGCGYLAVLDPVPSDPGDTVMPRGGAPGTIQHTREGF